MRDRDECHGYEWRGEVPRKCHLPPGHKAADGTFLGRSCKGTDPDATRYLRLRHAGFARETAEQLDEAGYDVRFVRLDQVLGVAG